MPIKFNAAASPSAALPQLVPLPQPRGNSFLIEGAFSGSGVRYAANRSLVKQDGSTWVCLKSGSGTTLGKPGFHNDNWEIVTRRGPAGKSISDAEVRGYVEEQAERLAQKHFEQIKADLDQDILAGVAPDIFKAAHVPTLRGGEFHELVANEFIARCSYARGGKGLPGHAMALDAVPMPGVQPSIIRPASRSCGYRCLIWTYKGWLVNLSMMTPPASRTLLEAFLHLPGNHLSAVLHSYSPSRISKQTGVSSTTVTRLRVGVLPYPRWNTSTEQHKSVSVGCT